MMLIACCYKWHCTTVFMRGKQRQNERRSGAHNQLHSNIRANIPILLNTAEIEPELNN